jgi:hypothetical protein
MALDMALAMEMRENALWHDMPSGTMAAAAFIRAAPPLM